MDLGGSGHRKAAGDFISHGPERLEGDMCWEMHLSLTSCIISECYLNLDANSNFEFQRLVRFLSVKGRYIGESFAVKSRANGFGLSSVVSELAVGPSTDQKCGIDPAHVIGPSGKPRFGAELVGAH
jgi:hypothetical protein